MQKQIPTTKRKSTRPKIHKKHIPTIHKPTHNHLQATGKTKEKTHNLATTQKQNKERSAHNLQKINTRFIKTKPYLSIKHKINKSSKTQKTVLRQKARKYAQNSFAEDYALEPESAEF